MTESITCMHLKKQRLDTLCTTRNISVAFGRSGGLILHHHCTLFLHSTILH